MGLGGGVQLFKNIDLHFPIGHPGLGLVLTFVNEIQQIQNDLVLCVFSLPIPSVFFFFPLYYSLTHQIFQKAFLSFILHTANHTCTHTHT